MKHLFYFILLTFAVSSVAAQKTPSADEILKEAYAVAAKEKKHVFVIFHASWCGWCHKMDTAMNDPSVRKFFNDHFVVRHLAVLESGGKKHLENPGAMELLKKHNGADQGIPFWLIFDSKGRLLADSQMRPEGASPDSKGVNCGCPATKEEVDHFIKVLRKTTNLNEENLAKIEKRFRQNE